jgi:CDP-diacylglycerol--glycerol-3-phosphate 3-phosphatidyltransferase
MKNGVKSIPNILTIIRIIFIPILIISFYLEGKTADYMTAIIFLFASVTDCIDGFLARRLKAQSNFGRMLDPIADKMLVASTLIMLVNFKIAPVIPIVAILCREIFVSGMREYLATKMITVNVSILGKIKTATQMVAIVILLLGEKNIQIMYIDLIGKILLWISAVLTLWSGYIYIKQNIKNL